MGYEPVHHPQGYVRIADTAYRVEFEIIIKAIDGNTLEILAAYHPVPTGLDSEVLKWLKNIFKRGWGNASVKLSEGKELLVVRAQLRLSDNSKADKGQLYYTLFSISEYFKCFAEDTNYAEDLGLKFEGIDAKALFKVLFAE